MFFRKKSIDDEIRGIKDNVENIYNLLLNVNNRLDVIESKVKSSVVSGNDVSLDSNTKNLIIELMKRISVLEGKYNE